MKKCRACGKEKSRKGFYLDKRAKDGLLSCCKECQKEKAKAQRDKKKRQLQSLDLPIEKTCIRCGMTLPRDEFYVSYGHGDGKLPYCKTCAKEVEKKARVENHEEWKKTHRKRQKAWRAENKDKVRINKRGWKRRRRARDPIFRLKESLYARLRLALHGKCKSASTMELLGCSIEDLKRHLESKFQKGMTWDNYGEWHIDHIRPCADFDLSIPSQQRECFHYKNLQPLWCADNLAKGSRFQKEQPKHKKA
jgi:hypothetical protein